MCNSSWRSNLTLCRHHTDVFTLLQTVCYIQNNKYSLKQFSVSRMGSMTLESQKTWCPIDYIIVSTPTDHIGFLISVDHIEPLGCGIILFVPITLASKHYSTYWLYQVFPITPIILIPFTALSILGLPVSFAIVASSAVLIIWVFSCLNGYSQSLSQWYWDPVITDYIGTKVPPMSCCLNDFTTSFHWTPHCYFIWYNSLYQEAHLDISSNLVSFQTYAQNKQKTPYSFIEHRERNTISHRWIPLLTLFHSFCTDYVAVKWREIVSVWPSSKNGSLIFVSISAFEVLTHRKKWQSQISVSPRQDPGIPLTFWRKQKRRSRHNACSIREIRRTVSF